MPPVDDLKTQATEMVRKVLSLGIGAVFLTEESLRALVRDFKLPKELIAGILESAQKTKSEFFAKLSDDLVSKMKDQVNVQNLISEILEKHDIQITVNFTKKTKSS